MALQAQIRAVPLSVWDEDKFIRFLEKDKILHIFTIYDLRRFRDKTKVWIAFKDDEICGYTFIFDNSIVHTHGTVESVEPLMKCISLERAIFVIEKNHLNVVERFYRPEGPTDEASIGNITKYYVLELRRKDFNPLIRHSVKKLGIEDLDEVSECLGEEWRTRIRNAISSGLAYGAYEDGKLVSVATVPEIVDEIAMIRGVFTLHEYRNKGYATSVCSALINELLNKRKIPILWVAKDNLPARKIYEKLGFKRTKHVLLGFKAAKIV